MSATTGRQGRSSAIDRRRRLQELNRQEAELEAQEQAERQAEAERQRQARDRHDAEVRRRAYEVQRRREEAHREYEASVDELHDLASRLVAGEADEQAVVAAYRRREEAKAVSEAWELGFRELKGDPALAGRR